MDFELNPRPRDDAQSSDGAGFGLTAKPVVADDAPDEPTGLPHSVGEPILCLMPRDPHTLFAYWDLDWTEAFRDVRPADRKVHLRVTDADGVQQEIEVEPLAASCYVPVKTADAVYTGDIGFYQPATTWNSLARSEAINTPPEDLSNFAEDNFATVPFHLSFQRMIDMLRESRSDDRPLVVQLSDARERAANGVATQEEANLADAVREIESTAPTPGANAQEIWRRHRLERILGFGATSPAEAFGGSSCGS